MLILKAADFAARKHSLCRRKDVEASPYINHPIAVARLLADEGGVTDEEILAAALLHDTIEDTDTNPEELEEEFGSRIRKLVQEVTDDKEIEKAERKRLQVEHAKQLSPDAVLVKLADKICNVLDVIHNPPQGWSLDRRQEYLNWAEIVVRNCREAHEGLLKKFEDTLVEGRELFDIESRRETPAA